MKLKTRQADPGWFSSWNLVLGWDNIRMGQPSSLKRPPTALLSFLDIYTLFFKEKGMLHSGKYVAIPLCGNVCVFVLMCKLCCWCYYSRFFGFHVSWSSIKVCFFLWSFLQSTSWQNASCSSADALKQSSSNPYACPFFLLQTSTWTTKSFLAC